MKIFNFSKIKENILAKRAKRREAEIERMSHNYCYIMAEGDFFKLKVDGKTSNFSKREDLDFLVKEQEQYRQAFKTMYDANDTTSHC
jgi:hypothetical protein